MWESVERYTETEEESTSTLTAEFEEIVAGTISTVPESRMKKLKNAWYF